MVGLVVVTIVSLAQGTVARAPDVSVLVLIVAGALVVMYRWKSKLAPPAVLAAGALVGGLIG